MSLEVKVRRRLLQASARFVGRAGVTFNGPSHFRIEKLVQTGVKRMHTAKLLEDEARLQLAETNLRRVVDAMAKRSTVSGTFPVIDVECMEFSLKKLCPLWPYC